MRNCKTFTFVYDEKGGWWIIESVPMSRMSVHVASREVCFEVLRCDPQCSDAWEIYCGSCWVQYYISSSFSMPLPINLLGDDKIMIEFIRWLTVRNRWAQEEDESVESMDSLSCWSSDLNLELRGSTYFVVSDERCDGMLGCEDCRIFRDVLEWVNTSMRYELWCIHHTVLVVLSPQNISSSSSAESRLCCVAAMLTAAKQRLSSVE